MLRKLMTLASAATLVALSALASHAHAVGMGELRLNSALHQPFHAEIELFDIDDPGSDELVARLATTEDFERVGLQRAFFLRDLDFSIERRRDGQPYIRVTSSGAIVEPFVDLLVELRWPQGRMLREYTVLLDPPTDAQRPAPAVAAPETAAPQAPETGRVVREERVREGTEVTLREGTAPSRWRSPAERHGATSYGPTDRDDTLWRIASRTRPSERVSVQQQMLALVELNPEAFFEGNVNRLKAGYELALPSEEEALALSSQEAVEQVARHHREWEAYKSGEPVAAAAPAGTEEEPELAAPLDATAAPERAEVAEPAPEGELRILARETDMASDEAATTAPGGAGAERLETLEAQLAASEAQRERVTGENRELGERVERLAAQLEESQRRIEVRDEQLAQLQQQLEEIRQQRADARQDAGGGIAEGALPLPGGPVSGWALVASVLLGLALVVWLLMARRRGAGDEDDRLAALTEPQLASVAATGAAAPEAGTQRREPRIETLEERDAERAGDDAGAVPVRPVMADERAASVGEATDDAEPPSAQTSDVIAEAEIYIAYNRHHQAVSLLESALDQDPQRSDVRYKLLELHAETGDRGAFDAQLAELTARSEDPALLGAARRLQERLDGAGGGDDAGTGAQGTEPPVIATLDAESDAPPADAPAAGETLVDAPEPVLDPLEDAGAGAPGAQAARAEASAAGGGDDLGLDFEQERRPFAERAQEASSETEPSQAAQDGDDLEFDLEDLRLDFEPGAGSKGNGRPADDTAEPPPLAAAAQSGGNGADDELEFLDDVDAAATKLDLARAYVDMGDREGAKEILDEVLNEGNDEQQRQAGALLGELR